MTNSPIYYYLRLASKSQDIVYSFNKIKEYLMTFVGDIEIEIDSSNKTSNSAIIYYVGTPTVAFIKTEKNNQITVTMSPDDNVTINLINNKAQSLGFRIYNPQTNCYLPNDVNLFDLTTVKVDPSIKNILKKYNLTPIFQFRGSLIFFCVSKDMSIHLVNRHLLEYMLATSVEKLYVKEFSIKIAENISQFVALFDRGLINLNFQSHIDGDSKIINLSGFDLKKLPINTKLNIINFVFDEENQSFVQQDVTSTIPKKYIAMKIGQDYNYSMINGKLTKFLNVSVFN